MLITLAMGLSFVVLALAVDMLFGEVKALRAAIAAQREAIEDLQRERQRLK